MNSKFFLFLALILFPSTLFAAPTDAEWSALSENFLMAERSEIEKLIGTPISTAHDELLSAETVLYAVAAPESSPFPAKGGTVYYLDGVAQGFSTSYEHAGTRLLTRFLLDNLGQILLDSDRSAIAGSGYDCNVLRVFALGSSEDTHYILARDLYTKMERTGDLPPIPPQHGRKGFAA